MLYDEYANWPGDTSASRETLLKRIEVLVDALRGSDGDRLKSLEGEVARLKRRLDNLEAWYRRPPAYRDTTIPAGPWWQPPLQGYYVQTPHEGGR